MAKVLSLLILLAVCLTALTLWRVAHRRATFEAEFPPEGQFLGVNGHKVHYLQMGAGPDLVLIHGASGNMRDFTFALAPALAQHYRVTMFDRPGLGYTPPLARSGVTVADQTDLLVAAAGQLGISRPVVVGHSFGGALLMDWAVHHPDRIAAAVSISGATYPWPGKIDRFYALLSRPVIGPIMANLLAAWVPRSYVRDQVAGVFAPQSPPEGYADTIGAELVLRPASLIANAQQRTDLRPELRALSSRYPALTLPIEIVHGSADTTVGLDIHSAALERDAAHAHLTRLPGVGHMPHHAEQAQVIAAIQRAAARAGLH